MGTIYCWIYLLLYRPKLCQNTPTPRKYGSTTHPPRWDKSWKVGPPLNILDFAILTNLTSVTSGNTREPSWVRGCGCKCYYHPHPKDGEGTVLTGVCLSTPGIPLSQVLSQVCGPRSFLVLARGGHPSPGWGHPPPSQDRTDVPPPPSQDRTGVFPQPGQDWHTPPPGWGWGPPPRTERQSEHLLPGRRYASCVQAGGLSCSICD